MNNTERTRAILHYENYDRLPIVHFGYWGETLQKWRDEGHLTAEEAATWTDSNATDVIIAAKLGFDFDWQPNHGIHTGLLPGFAREIIETLPDGSRHVRGDDGVTLLERDGAGSIPMEIAHLLTDRASWEEHYKSKLQAENRVDPAGMRAHYDAQCKLDRPQGFHVGSLFGNIRTWLGVEGSSYLLCDDEELYREIIDTVGNMTYAAAKEALATGLKFDYAHFWEDICFKNGPLVIPEIFAEMVGLHYKKITELLAAHDIDIVSLDCDGCIDSLLPIWLENGVNTMFPIEVGTWNASIAPWREKYGKAIRGVGGMNKTIFAYDYAAVDAEIERLKPLVALGGYIPCPDHRIAPDAKWENVQYYCEQMHKAFS